MPSPLFSKRHYVWLAAFARANLNPPQRAALCAQLATDNPAFNRSKFEVACGITAPREPHFLSIVHGKSS